jgi:hypothetical protein
MSPSTKARSDATFLLFSLLGKDSKAGTHWFGDQRYRTGPAVGSPPSVHHLWTSGVRKLEIEEILNLCAYRKKTHTLVLRRLLSVIL